MIPERSFASLRVGCNFGDRGLQQIDSAQCWVFHKGMVNLRLRALVRLFNCSVREHNIPRSVVCLRIQLFSQDIRYAKEPCLVWLERFVMSIR